VILAPVVVPGVIEGDFHGFEGDKPIGSSGDYTDFVVETLNGAGGDLSSGAKPVQASGSCARSMRATFFIGSRRLLNAR